ncbi:hypothetical protein IQQ51_25915 [Vibrio sp. OPT18]|nr:hypothetical protein [Vibrio sp. OPT18]
MLAILAAILNFAIDVQLYSLQTAANPRLGLANQQPSFTPKPKLYFTRTKKLDDERRQQGYT